MKFSSSLALFALAFHANAASIGQQSQNFSISDSNQVGFFQFTLDMSQSVDIFTQGPANDPQIFLFSGVPSTATLLTGDDDSCPDSFCGQSGFFRNSLIQNTALSSGDYTVAVSDFSFNPSEAISGQNPGVDPGDIVVTVRDAGPLDGGVFVPVLGPTMQEIIQTMQDIAQIEQQQTQTENTIRVSSAVIGNRVNEVIANVFGFDLANSSFGNLPQNKLAGSSDSAEQSAYLPDNFWGKHIYTSLSEDGNNLGYTTDLYQFIGGLDKRIGDFFVGTAISYVYGETNQAGNNNSTHTIGVTPYAAYRINSFLFASGLASYNYTSVNGTQGRRDADIHNYSGELTLNAFKQIEAFLVKGRAGLRYTHNYTSLKGTIDADYDQLTWIGDIEFGYQINSKIQVFTGVLYEYVDREATVGTTRAAISEAVHDGVAYFRGGVNYKVNNRVTLGLDGSSDLNDNNNDILSFGANINITL